MSLIDRSLIRPFFLLWSISQFNLPFPVFVVKHPGYLLVCDGFFTSEGINVVVSVGLVLLSWLQLDPILVVWTDISHCYNHDVEVLISSSGDCGLDQLWNSIVGSVHGKLEVILLDMKVSIGQMKLCFILELICLMRSIFNLSDHCVLESFNNHLISFILSFACSKYDGLAVGASSPQVLERFLKLSLFIKHLLFMSLCLSLI